MNHHNLNATGNNCSDGTIEKGHKGIICRRGGGLVTCAAFLFPRRRHSIIRSIHFSLVFIGRSIRSSIDLPYQEAWILRQGISTQVSEVTVGVDGTLNAVRGSFEGTLVLTGGGVGRIALVHVDGTGGCVDACFQIDLGHFSVGIADRGACCRLRIDGAHGLQLTTELGIGSGWEFQRHARCGGDNAGQVGAGIVLVVGQVGVVLHHGQIGRVVVGHDLGLGAQIIQSPVRPVAVLVPPTAGETYVGSLRTGTVGTEQVDDVARGGFDFELHVELGHHVGRAGLLVVRVDPTHHGLGAGHFLGGADGVVLVLQIGVEGEGRLGLLAALLGIVDGKDAVAEEAPKVIAGTAPVWWDYGAAATVLFAGGRFIVWSGWACWEDDDDEKQSGGGGRQEEPKGRG